jgi:hypothetical protein
LAPKLFKLGRIRTKRIGYLPDVRHEGVEVRSVPEKFMAFESSHALAERDEIRGVELALGRKVEWNDVMYLESLSGSARGAFRRRLEVSSASRPPLGRPLNKLRALSLLSRPNARDV